MTSRIALRKQQQSIGSTASALSVGYLAGYAVLTPLTRWDKVWLDGQEGYVGFLQVPKDSSVQKARIVAEANEVPQSVDITSSSATVAGLTIDPRENSTRLWEAHNLVGSTELEPEPVTNIDQIYVTLESGSRPQRPVRYVVDDDDTYRAIFKVSPARWIISGDLSQHFVGVYHTYAEANAALDALRPLVRTRSSAAFGDLVDRYQLKFDRASSIAQEIAPFNTLEQLYFGVGPPPPESGLAKVWYIGIYGRGSLSGQGPYVRHWGLESPWAPSDEEIRTGTPPSRETEAIPQSLSVQFQQADGTVVETQSILVAPEVETRQTLFLKRTTNPTTPTPKVQFDLGAHANWLRSAITPLPARIQNPVLDTYPIKVSWGETFPIQVFIRSAPIDIPSNATVGAAGQLTYSGSWDGAFQSARCRCPAWTLYDVLRAERWGIEQAAARIDANSFLLASRYCNELIDGQPRWAFDGELKGRQADIVSDLLQLMQGWLSTDTRGRWKLSIERPQTARWLVCPAIVSGGQIVYRHALPQGPVRARYTDRLTGRTATTSGTDDVEVKPVPWQDPAVAQRAADWETFRRQHLLDTVEFTLPWSHHAVEVGDLMELHDPVVAGVRTAGRIVESHSTDGWLQLDGFPWEFWPAKVATATLMQGNGRAAVDPALWGYVASNAIRPTIKVQQVDGGLQSFSVTRLAWAPGGRPDQNRVWVSQPVTGDLSRRVFAVEHPSVQPTFWRVQSVTEAQDGRQFTIVATRYLSGMHTAVETGVPLMPPATRWTPTCGTQLALFRGHWDSLNQRYPKAGSGPWDDGGTFDDLTTSCV